MADSEAGSLISFGAVAVLAILGYKKIQSIFGGSSGSGEGNTAEQAAARIVSGGGTVKETVKEVIVQSTGSGSESGKFDPLSWYGIFGSEAPSWYTELIQGNKNTDKTAEPVEVVSASKVTQPSVTSSYVGSDAGYGSVSPAASVTRVSGSNVVIPSSGVGSAAGYGSVSPAASVVRSNKTSSTSTSTPKTYTEGGLTKYKDAAGKVHVMVK